MTTEPDRVPMDSVLTCVHCGYSLRGAEARGQCPECGHAVTGSHKPMLVFSARDPFEAHLVKHELEAAGVEAHIMGENLSTGRGEFPVTAQTQPSVWVRECDRAAAEQVIKQYVESNYGDSAGAESNAPTEPWICPNCHEEVEGDFALCWNCETPREADSG